MNSPAKKKILIIEDDAILNALLVDQVNEFGHAAYGAHSRADAVELMDSNAFDLAIVDMCLPDSDGFQILEEFGKLCPLIILTAYGTVEQALRAVHSGAADYLFKPVSYESLKLAVQRTFETIELKRDVRHWQAQALRAVNETLVGSSPAVEEMRALIGLYANAGSTILIEGESGVGKELVARAIHQASNRAEARFVPIDCDPSQENLFASELFGHEQGAFQGADYRREGMLEIATEGTIYLSDVAEVSLPLQSKLLRVMETGMYRRLGGAMDLAADVRIIAATSRDLEELVKAGEFRSELYYRLDAFRIQVPPLRERRGDIRALAEHFMGKRSFFRGVHKDLGEETLKRLEACDWQGNVRELRNAIERGIIMSGQAHVIEPQHIGLNVGRARSGEGVTLEFLGEPTVDQMRNDYLRLLLDRYNGNRQKVASVLGISERNTYRLISRLGDEV